MMFIHGWLVDVNIIKIKIKPPYDGAVEVCVLGAYEDTSENVRGALHFERYHLIAWLPNQMIRREAVVACRRCFVTSQTVIKYGGYRQSNLILFGSCSCTSFLRGKKETKKTWLQFFGLLSARFFELLIKHSLQEAVPCVGNLHRHKLRWSY